MDRKIKFRGKEINTNNWIFGYLIADKSSTDIYELNIKGDGYFIVVDEKTVGQFTGLHDKNGNDIYEGDIIEYYAKELLVELNIIDGLYLKNINKPFCELFRYDMSRIIFDIENIKIIGNIHDNPELIKTTDMETKKECCSNCVMKTYKDIDGDIWCEFQKCIKWCGDYCENYVPDEDDEHEND